MRGLLLMQVWVWEWCRRVQRMLQGARTADSTGAKPRASAAASRARAAAAVQRRRAPATYAASAPRSLCQRARPRRLRRRGRMQVSAASYDTTARWVAHQVGGTPGGWHTRWEVAVWGGQTGWQMHTQSQAQATIAEVAEGSSHPQLLLTCVSLACAGLTVGEERGVVAFEERAHERHSGGLKDGRVRCAAGEDLVEAEAAAAVG